MVTPGSHKSGLQGNKLTCMLALYRGVCHAIYRKRNYADDDEVITKQIPRNIEFQGDS